LITKDIDGNGELKMDSRFGFCYATGGGHILHNHSDQDAVVLPIQDDGIIMNMQALDFQFIQ